MAADPIAIHEDLLRLKPSSALESVSLSKLARSGTAVLRQITDSAQAVAVKVQGQGAMVTLSQRQYDEMVELIQELQQPGLDDDGFEAALRQRFDKLVAEMNRPGAAEATQRALFASPETLSKNYRPGTTETGYEDETKA